MTRTLRILIVDDHKLFTAGLSAVLQMLPQTVRIEDCDNGHRALALLEAGEVYDLMLLDIEMPSINGLDLLSAIKHRNLTVRTMVVSAASEDALVARAMQAGARGFFPKSLAPPLMLQAIENVLAGERYLPEHLRARVLAAPVRQESANGELVLTDRQREILAMIERGLTNQQIADVLSVSLSTVKFHVTGLFKQLNVRTRTECVHVARKRQGMSSATAACR